jgi:hypothetical protein
MQAVQGFAVIVKVTVSPEAVKLNPLVGTQPAEALCRKEGAAIETNNGARITNNARKNAPGIRP